MKRYYIGILLFILVAGNLFAQEIVKMSAVKGNNYGVSYILPKTKIIITVEAEKTIKKAGQFYEYAENYLNISDPVIQDETTYAITNITVDTEGIPDKEKSYLVEFKAGTTAPYVSLSKEGVIYAINTDPEITSAKNKERVKSDNQDKPLPNPNSFLSEEILRAGSKAMQADLIAKQIFRLRETRNDILTGDADNMPPDGNAYQVVMERLDQQEKSLTSMFKGTESKEYITKTYTIIPDEDNIDKDVLFRFSKKLGFLDKEDLAGAPLILSLTNKDPKETPILTPKEQKDLEKKFSQGIIYNIPAKATLKVDYANKTWINKDYEIAQYGTLEVLAPKMFEDNKMPVKVIFYPDLGSIKQVIQ